MQMFSSSDNDELVMKPVGPVLIILRSLLQGMFVENLIKEKFATKFDRDTHFYEFISRAIRDTLHSLLSQPINLPDAIAAIHDTDRSNTCALSSER